MDIFGWNFLEKHKWSIRIIFSLSEFGGGYGIYNNGMKRSFKQHKNGMNNNENGATKTEQQEQDDFRSRLLKEFWYDDKDFLTQDKKLSKKSLYTIKKFLHEAEIWRKNRSVLVVPFLSPVLVRTVDSSRYCVCCPPSLNCFSIRYFLPKGKKVISHIEMASVSLCTQPFESSIPQGRNFIWTIQKIC